MNSAEIVHVHAREVLDSRGWPTIEAEVELEGGTRGRAIAPSGASTGAGEAHELRDGGPRHDGRGVLRAVENVKTEIHRAVRGIDAADQSALDLRMIELDGTPEKKRLGANAILAVSCAAARAAAKARRVPLADHLAGIAGLDPAAMTLPLPMTNILSGGLHAEGALDFQDFLIVCSGARSMTECLEWTARIWRRTREALARRGFRHLGVADEGGFGAPLPGNAAALEVLDEAVLAAGLTPGREVHYALDVASTHFHDPAANRYALKSEGRELGPDEMISLLETLAGRHAIVSAEDPLGEDSWDDWAALTARLGAGLQLVGDDLFTTNPKRLARGLAAGAANSVLVKMNQIGSLTETLETLRMAQKAGYTTVLSARSGETEDPFMSDLAAGWGAGQIKIGSITRSSRLAKYNQLLRLEERLSAAGRDPWPGTAPLRRWIDNRGKK